MGAHHDGTGAQSAYGLSERMSETDVRKGRSLSGESCFHHFIPIAFIFICSSNHCPVVCENMYKAYELFILKMRVAVGSMIIYFMPPD
jgi:hypothetical protein